MDIAASRAADTAVPQLTLIQLFFKFLRFGMLAFGGPVAQIAMIRQSLVDEERWIDPAKFNRLLAVLQVLPGPEAHELCVHFGMLARGRPGGIAAGMGFMLPGLVLMMLAGWAYVNWVAGDIGLSGVLLGVQVVVLAVIARAVFRIGQHAVSDAWLGGIATAGLIATLANVPFWLPLVAAGAAYALSHRPWAAALACVLAIVLAAALAKSPTLLPAAAAASAEPATLAALFIAGLKGGLLTFGGAYTAIPYVRADTVDRGWLSDATFLDGIALAGVLPAPLVIFATFAGYVAGGPVGALAITAGMFLPAFGFSLIFYERLETLVDNPALHRFLAGVAAVVVGIIAATFLQLGQATGLRLTHPIVAGILFCIAAAIAWRVKGAWVTPAILAGGALCGWALPL